VVVTATPGGRVTAIYCEMPIPAAQWWPGRVRRQRR